MRKTVIEKGKKTLTHHQHSAIVKMKSILVCMITLYMTASCSTYNITVNVLRGDLVKLDGVEKVSTRKGCWIDHYTKKEKCPYFKVHHYKGYESKNFFWYYKPEGQQHYSLVGYTVNGTSNCSVSRKFEGRVDTCGVVFQFRARLEDVGAFKSRIKLGKSNSKVLFYKVDVQVLAPVLVPTAQGKYNLLLMCCDRNPKADTFFLYNHPYGVKTRRILTGDKRILITQMDANFPVDENVKCCSRWKEFEKCGPSTFVVVDGSLCTETAPGRNWCQKRGVDLKYNELTSHDSWRQRGSCAGTNVCKVKNIGAGVHSVCEGKEVKLSGELDRVEYWRKQRENVEVEKWWTIGSNGTCYVPGFNYCGANLKFSPTVTDGGVYRQRTNYSVLDFNVTVIKQPGVMLQLDHLSYEYVKVTCVHGEYELMKIQWHIDGTYEKATVSGANNETLTILPDCWYSNKHWNAHVRIYCTASGYTWQGRSSQFFIESYKDGCAWRRKAGFHILMSHHNHFD